MTIHIAPDRVLIKVTKEQRDRLFSKKITNHLGEQVELFFDIPAEGNDDRRFQQALHWGIVVAVGALVKDVQINDIAVIDYLVDTSEKDVAGYIDGDKLMAVRAVTTYHDEDVKTENQRKFMAKAGDYKEISPLMALIRNGSVIARDPYVVFHYQRPLIERILADGFSFEEKPDLRRLKVLSVPEDYGIKSGDSIVIKDVDVIDRNYLDKAIQIAFVQDCIAVSSMVKS